LDTGFVCRRGEKMNKTLVAVMLVAVLALGAYVVARKLGPGRPPAGPAQPAVETATDTPEPSPGAVVFELKYHGFDTPDDPLSYRSYWGFGGPAESNDPFVRAVKSRVKECTLVYHSSLPKAHWSVVELQDKRPVAFYFDANGDGRLSDNEKFLPAQPAGSNFGYPHAFLTSDFMIRTEDNRELPFRVMLVGSSYGSNISFMWSPACVLEGQATLAGRPMELVLYGAGFSGSFTTFGSCSFALLPAAQKQPGYVPRSPLSSLIQYEGTFYRVKLDGTHEKDKTVRVSFERDTTPTGRMTVAFQGGETLKTRFTSATITGATDNSVRFNTGDGGSTLPAGRYRLASAYVNYGASGDDEWRTNFNEGPAFEVNAGQTSRVELGGLTLSIGAVNEQDRYRSDVKEQTTFAKGTAIYLTPRIQGKAGEVYTRFSQREAGANNQVDAKPHLTITDPDGKQIVSADLEYG
jgi:hypothetical protein